MPTHVTILAILARDAAFSVEESTGLAYTSHRGEGNEKVTNYFKKLYHSFRKLEGCI